MQPNRRAGSVAAVAAMLVLVGCSSDAKSTATDPVTIEIFMEVQAHHTDAAKVDTVLRHSRGIVRMRFVSRARAFRELRCFLRDQPDLLSTIRDTDLPESFSVTVERRARAERLRRQLSSFPGVESVQIPPTEHQQQRMLRTMGRARFPRSSNAGALQGCLTQP